MEITFGELGSSLAPVLLEDIVIPSASEGSPNTFE
jgi:hypothetical protein